MSQLVATINYYYIKSIEQEVEILGSVDWPSLRLCNLDFATSFRSMGALATNQNLNYLSNVAFRLIELLADKETNICKTLETGDDLHKKVNIAAIRANY